jgi:ribonuclease BN (tRNA processing enzyme)
VNLHVLGSSGTAPVAGNPGSGYLVSTSSSHLLLDAGPGVAMALMGVVDPSTLDAVFLSHRHPDHCSDIFALFHHFAYGAQLPVAPLPVFAPPGLGEAAAQFVGADADHPWNEVFEWRVANGRARAGELALLFGESSHSVAAACVLVDDGGRSLAYSGDTGPGGDLETLAAGADTLICEATYQDDTGDDYPFHLSARQAGEIAARAGVSRLVLTHLRSTLDPAQSAAEAAAVFDGEILVATPGMTIEI